ncbi:MAG: hypothetical protein KDA84_24800 [Planctomycetaceae bacterium]|nr:hypothetical protein [Planctomycetaceae bacterium]
MIKFISPDGQVQTSNEMLTMTKIERFVGENFDFHKLKSDDVLIHSPGGDHNEHVSTVANFKVQGNAIICSEEDIA